MGRARELRWAILAAALLLAVLAAPADARKFQMSGTWMMRKGQTFVPLQFASLKQPGADWISMGLWTEAVFSAKQVVSDVGGANATGAGPARVRIPKHAWVRNYGKIEPLFGTMLVQITSMFAIDAPHAAATLEAGGGPGGFTWCPANPACVNVGLPVGGRIIYVAGPNQFGGTMQMGLGGGGLVSVKGVGAGVLGHIVFGW